MMAFFSGKKRPKILMVAILVMTLVATYAVPMTVFADASEDGSSSQIVVSGANGEGDDSQGGDDDSKGEDNSQGGDDDSKGEDNSQGGDDDSKGEDDKELGGGDSGDRKTDGEGINDGKSDEGLGDGSVPGGMSLMMTTLSSPEYAILLEKTVSPATASPGDEVTYTFKVTNAGTKQLKNVKLMDNMLGLEHSFGALSANWWEKTKTFSKKYKIPSSTPLDTILTNEATVTGDNGEKGEKRLAVTATASADVTIVAPYGITLEKKVSPETASPGDEVTYTFRVKNTGTKQLKNVTIKDPMLGSSWKINIGDLNKGATKTSADYKYRIPSSTPLNSILTNEATVTGDNGGKGEKRLEVTATATADVSIVDPYGLTLEKTVSTETASPGDWVTYKFKVTNTGTKTLYHISVADAMVGNPLLYAISLDPGKSTQFESYYRIPVRTPVDSTLTNTATVTGKNKYLGGEEVASATDTADVTIIPEHRISLAKTVSPTTAKPGDTVEYTFIVSNTGKNKVYSVILTDPIFGTDWYENIGNIDRNEIKEYKKTYTIPDGTPDGSFVNNATATGFKQVPTNLQNWILNLLQWINDHITTLPWLSDWLATNVIQATGSATVTIEQNGPLTETVKFYVLKKGLSRPTSEGSRPTANYTVSLGALTITVPEGSKPDKGRSLVNEFASGADANAVENKAVQLSSQADYNALMAAIEAKMISQYSSYLPTGQGETWYIDWYDFKWENDGWHIDGDIKVVQNQDPPEDPDYEYKVYYKVIESNEILHTVTGAAAVLPVTISEPDIIKNNSNYRFYSNTHGDTANVTFNLIPDVTSYEATVLYEPVNNDPAVGWYRVRYLVSGSGIEVAAPVENTTTLSSIRIAMPALNSGYTGYTPVAADNATLDGEGYVIINHDDPSPGEHDVIVWYEQGSNEDPSPEPGRRGSSRTSTAIVEEPVPAAPVTPEAIDNGEMTILNEEAPAGPLPKTGGIPSLLLYGLGALLAGGGAALKLRSRKR